MPQTAPGQGADPNAAAGGNGNGGAQALAQARGLHEFLGTIDKLTEDDQRKIVEQGIVLLESFYAHLPLKRAMHAIDPLQRLRLLRRRLRRLTSEISFHHEMTEIFTSLRDLHTNYILPAHFARMVAVLPFDVECCFEAGRHVYLVSRVKADLGDPGFVRGVEVTYWNGIPIDRAVEIAAECHAGSNPDARHARGVAGLTIRAMVISPPPDEEWVVVGYRDAQGQDRQVRADWRVINPDQAADLSRPEFPISDAAATAYGLDIEGAAVKRAQAVLYAPAAVAANRRIQATRARAMEAATLSGVAGRAELEAAAAAGVEAEVQGLDSTMPTKLVARVVEEGGRQYGYIRIHTFDVPDDERFIREFIRLIELPQFPKDGLILDVRGNPGGLIWAGERLLQLLTPRRIEPCRVQFINTPRTLELCRRTPSLQPWVPSLERAVETGAVFSAAFPITDPGRCNDIGQRYRGPVVLITDARCYSTTDIFAAGFQDHGIGRILGVDGNTGAGGANVWTLGLIRHFFTQAGLPSPLEPLPQGADMRVAIRRTLRVGPEAGTELEDLGVTPDERHQMTRADLLEGNVDLLRHAARLLSGQPVAVAPTEQPAAPPQRQQPAPPREPPGDRDTHPQEETADRTETPMSNSEQDFMDALRQFESQGAVPGAASATAAGASSPQQQFEQTRGTSIMSGSDQEFMDALRAFESSGAGGGAQAGAFGAAEVQGAGAMGGGGASDEEFFRALAQFGGPSSAAAAFAGAGALAPGADVAGAAPSLGNICSTYRSVKPVITGVLGFIGAIPGIGGAAATAIRGLLTVLDAVCAGSGTAAQLCDKWKQVRVIVVRIVDAISKIPFVGGRAAAAIRTLIAALDTVCRFA